MYLRLRQIALVARKLEPVVNQFRDVFGIEVCHRAPGIIRRGLENALLPIGPVFIEIVAPVQSDTTAERFLERRKGEGGYMYIMDCDNIGHRREHVKALGTVRIIAENKRAEFSPVEGFQLHPRDIGGAILSIATHAAGEDLFGGFEWAGPEWQKFVRHEPLKGVLGAELQSDDPDRMAARWSEVLEHPLSEGPGGVPELEFDLGFARFVRDRDGRGEGLSAVHLEATDVAGVLEAAKRAGVPTTADRVEICGTRFVLHGLQTGR
jgi:Glyoxalase-like domain